MHSTLPDSAVSGTTDRRPELTALVAGCGIHDSDRMLFSIAGRDRMRWLNSMVTNNIRDLPPGHGVYAFVLNAQGSILGDLYVYNRGESLVAAIERQQTETLLQILKRYIIMDKVEIEDLSGRITVLGVIGPNAAKVLGSAGLISDLATLQFSDLNWNGAMVTVVRGDNPSFAKYEIWVLVEEVEKLRDSLTKAGAEPVHEATLEAFRILCGIPKAGQDIKERILPQETGQERALNFTKGCYIGQEIVERIRARGNVHRAFMGFEIEGPAPAPGTKIQSSGKDVGEITSVAAATLKGKRLALGYLRKEAAAAELLTAGEATVKPQELPFSGIFD